MQVRLHRVYGNPLRQVKHIRRGETVSQVHVYDSLRIVIH